MIKVSIKNKSIVFECDNNQIVQKVAQLVKDAIALTDDVPEFEEVQEPKKAVGRPSPSCFENESQEKDFKEALAGLKKQMLACKYSINTVSAYISCKTIGRYSNQKYFCNLLHDAGIDVNYTIFMRELDKMHQEGDKMMIKLDKYFNHFNHSEDVE